VPALSFVTFGTLFHRQVHGCIAADSAHSRAGVLSTCDFRDEEDKMLKVGITITMLLGGLAGDAAAAPMVWYLNAQEQATGQSITGFFTYDPVTGFSTDWNFQEGGMTFLSPFPLSCTGLCIISSSNFDPETHSVFYQTCILIAGICYPTEISTGSSNLDNIFSFNSFGHQTLSMLQLEPTQPLTDAGGTIPLIPAAPCMPGVPPVCDSNSPGSYIGGYPAPASPFFLTPLTGSVTLVPEPESVIYVLLGVAVLAARRGRRFL